MTLDITSFIDSKGGNAEEIRESQRKRGEAVELVDQVIEMYAEWVKSTYRQHPDLDRPRRVLIVTYRGLRAQRPQQTGKCGSERDRSQEEGMHPRRRIHVIARRILHFTGQRTRRRARGAEEASRCRSRSKAERDP